MQVVLVILGYLGSATGSTVLIAIGSALSRLWAEGRPRQRIAAIRQAAETKALLGDADELVIRAVEGHMHSEAARLQSALDRRNAAIVRREQRVPGKRARSVLALAAIATLLVALLSPVFGASREAIVWLTLSAGAVTGATLGWTVLNGVDRFIEKRRHRRAAAWIEEQTQAPAAPSDHQ